MVPKNGGQDADQSGIMTLRSNFDQRNSRSAEFLVIVCITGREMRYEPVILGIEEDSQRVIETRAY